ncbi:MAG: hypothetical protein HUN04_24845 [Desulfobacter sp.]|nr:MAG: hypothetical protein HUN04_24845 [Desulfobacter sp.]
MNKILKKLKFRAPAGGGGKRKKKKNKSPRIRKKLNLPKRPGRILVFETTGSALYGAVAACGLGPDCKMGAVAVSTAPEMGDAVAEVVAGLKQGKKKRLPKTAVLITPSAASDLLSLPVNPKKPRPRPQMAEMVRWELEEVFFRQGELWSLGSLLQGAGHITAEQRREAEASADGTGPDVYGGLAAKEQVAQCLQAQEILAEMDDDLATGWCAQGGEGDGRFAWLAAGIGDGIRSRWQEAFKQNKIFLSWIYPQLGTVLPLVSGRQPGGGGWVLVHVRQEQAGLVRVEDGHIQAFTVKPGQGGAFDPQNLAQEVLRCLTPKTGHVFFAMDPELEAPVSEAFYRGLEGREVGLAMVAASGDMDTETCHFAIRSSMEGAARHALGRTPAGTLVRIEAQEPKPPLWKDKDFWPWALLVLLLAGLGGYDGYIRAQGDKYAWDLDLCEIELQNGKKMKQQAMSTISRANKLEETLAEKEKELAEQKRLQEILDTVIRYRQDLVPGMMEAIGNAVTDGVVLDKFMENEDRSGFYLEAWALKDTEGQEFGTKLNQALADWKYKVGDIKLTQGPGPIGLSGYILAIHIVRSRAGAGAKGGKNG